MEIFKNTNFDFLGKKWPFIIASLVLTAAGIGSLVMKGGPRYGIDFKGGTVTTVRFQNQVSEDQIRTSLSAKIPGEIVVQRDTTTNDVLISTELRDEKALDAARQLVVDTLLPLTKLNTPPDPTPLVDPPDTYKGLKALGTAP